MWLPVLIQWHFWYSQMECQCPLMVVVCAFTFQCKDAGFWITLEETRLLCREWLWLSQSLGFIQTLGNVTTCALRTNEPCQGFHLLIYKHKDSHSDMAGWRIYRMVKTLEKYKHGRCCSLVLHNRFWNLTDLGLISDLAVWPRASNLSLLFAC